VQTFKIKGPKLESRSLTQGRIIELIVTPDILV